MSYKDGYSPFCNINKYIDTHVINNCNKIFAFKNYV